MLTQRIALSRVRGVFLLPSFVNLTPCENITLSQEVLLSSLGNSVNPTPSENITLSQAVTLPNLSSLGNSDYPTHHVNP